MTQATIVAIRESARALMDLIEHHPNDEAALRRGIADALKDLVNLEGTPTTSGSKILEGYNSPYDATIAARLRAAGAVIVGKTNMDEFAMGSSTEHSAYGPTRNPWDLERIPGGSGGGSAAALAAFEAPLAIGTDTGGSIELYGSIDATAVDLYGGSDVDTFVVTVSASKAGSTPSAGWNHERAQGVPMTSGPNARIAAHRSAWVTGTL